MGPPCGPTEELDAVRTEGGGLKAECRCPPGTVRHAPDGRCYAIHGQEPCAEGAYLSPAGECLPRGRCPAGGAWWPADHRCYKLLQRGPCPRGQLLLGGVEPRCACDRQRMSKQWHDGQCYELRTRGPCPDQHHVYLGEGRCGCDHGLPQRDTHTGRCYELNTIGPCDRGQVSIFDHYVTLFLSLAMQQKKKKRETN